MFSGHWHDINPKPGTYESGWNQYTNAFRQHKQPYSIILGNHDDETDLTREQIIELDMTHPFSLTQQSQTNSPGTNYVLEIFDKEGKQIESLIWLLDSHNNGCAGQPSDWGCVEKDQIDWIKNKYTQYGREIPGFGFVHIPVPEFVEMYDQELVSGQRGESICCPCFNTGLIDTFLDINVQAIFSGHDHDNDFGGFYRKNDKQIYLGYGRKSGYGSYGNLKKGGNVIKLRKSFEKLEFETYFIDETGSSEERKSFHKRNDRVHKCNC